MGYIVNASLNSAIPIKRNASAAKHHQNRRPGAMKMATFEQDASRQREADIELGKAFNCRIFASNRKLIAAAHDAGNTYSQHNVRRAATITTPAEPVNLPIRRTHSQH